MVKVYNKGVEPVIYLQNWKGTFVIHPKKYHIFHPDKAKKLIAKYEDLVDMNDVDSSIPTTRTKPVRKKSD